MALYKQQFPKYIHPILGEPTYYSWTSSKSSEDNFRYGYTINDITGELYKGNAYPISTDSVGFINPNQILKNTGDFIFQPEINFWTKVPNLLRGYRLGVAEEGKIDFPHSYIDSRSYGLLAWDDTYINYIKGNEGLNRITRYLTPITPYFIGVNNPLNGYVHKLYNDDNHTLRIFNGILRVRNELNALEYVLRTEWTEYYLDVYYKKPVGYYNIVHRRYVMRGSGQINPYYYATDSNDGNVIPNDMGIFVIDIPSGPANISNTTMTHLGYTNSDGVWTDQVFTTKPNLVATDDNKITYEIRLGRNFNPSPYLAAHRYEVMNSCESKAKTRIELAWQNRFGGVDYFTFDRKNEKSISIERDTFEKNRYYQNGINKITNNLSRGTTVYNTNVTTTWNVKTNFLNQLEIYGLEDLWVSPNVWAKIDGEWYSVINLVNKQVIHSKDTIGFKRYSFDIELANKIKF